MRTLVYFAAAQANGQILQDEQFNSIVEMEMEAGLEEFDEFDYDRLQAQIVRQAYHA